jgi:hypothetical protein
MMTFVVPFRSKASSNNWNYHSALLYRTIVSLLNQADRNFKVIVVYTDYPEQMIENENLIWLHFPFPFLKVRDITDYETYAKIYFSKEKFAEYAMDQARKSIYGSQLAKELGAKYIMSVDADDLVSNKIAKFVNKGYVHLDGKNYVYRYPKNLNQFCGSSYIVRTDLVSIPDFKSKNLLDYNFFSSHAWLKDRLRDYKNAILEPLPFYAIIYILNTGSWMDYGKTFEGGIMKKWAKLFLYGQFIKNELKKEFKIQKI